VPVIRFGLLLLVLGACGTSGSGSPSTPCTSRLDCPGGTDFGAACEGGYCSAPFAPGYLATLTMGVRSTTLRLQGIRSLRIFAIHPTTPGGATLKCPAPGTLADLNDPVKTNLSASVTERNYALTGGADTIQTGVFLNGPGRLVYVEVYRNDLNLQAPGEEGPAIGTGCVEQVEYAGDATTQKTVVLEIQPVGG